MWSVWLSVISLLIVISTHWVYRWRNPKCNGKLPPGSMGIPLIGETLDFLVSNNSLDIPPFIKKRMMKFGPIFRTSLAGRPMVVSSDPEFNYYVFQQEGKLVEQWYMDSFDKLIGQDVMTRVSSHRNIHKYLRNSILSHVGPEALKNKLLPHLEDAISQKLQGWSKLPSLEVRKSLAIMIFKLTAKLLMSYDAEKSGDNIDDFFSNFMEGFMKLPINIPGTAYHKCLQNRQKLVNLMTKIYEERKRNPEIGKGDFLDQILMDMKTETFLTDKFIIYVMFGILLASFETMSSTLTLAIMLLSDKPKMVKELTEEHEAILKSREDANSGLTWKEYKSMTFTHNVVNESLRLASVLPGILRKTIQDIEVNGYTIPKGWCLMVVPSAIQLNPNIYEDPLSFDPWRWQGISANVTAKNFIPFGAGMRTCAGADFSKVFMGVFLHVLVTKYRWTIIKGGEVMRTPALGFGDGIHIQVLTKHA
ncbi:cytochrome P450 87A3-like isoform X1 [Quercus lobata]|uniref:Cytochrome P450 87A3 n=1 Tax=Quercus lobata TaxID=97700 RepID=A0A7N2QZ13_QUELO|nr:cytochrome P450 87A3-like [Quercus lobata]XP_030956254.1 cytochrome P450 87A3-like isoform X1 [Quercus lobata]